MKHCFVILAMVLSLMLAPVADAQNFWQPTGMTNSAGSLVINTNGHIFVGASGSRSDIFRSTDNGNSWPRVFAGQSDHSVLTLAINANGHVFAGVTTGEVFRSTNNGTSWTPINFGLTNRYVLSLAINANGHIFAGIDKGGGVYRSMDNGDSWAQINVGFPNDPFFDVNALAFNSSGHVFAGTDQGIYRSTNNGDSWTQITTGLTNRIIESLAINANGHIFAGAFTVGVFRSTNNGGSWTLVNGNPNDDINSIMIISPSGHIFVGTRYFGVYRSTDNGNSWVQINSGLPNVTSLLSVEILAISPNGYMFAGTNAGVFRSVQPITVVRETSDNESLTAFLLEQNYPNPFNPETEIRFHLPKSNHVVLRISNTVGQVVRTLADERFSAGYHQVRWDGKDKNENPVSSGVYLYQLQAGTFSQTKRMSLLR
jgi:photosystem II stability/assembly factor-like uncharacterized protein